MHVELPGRDGLAQVVAEDAGLFAYRGSAASPQWLSEEDSRLLAVARPSGNVPPDQAADFVDTAVAGLPELLPYLGEAADELAGRLRDDHIRVREAAGQRVRRQIMVRAQQPPDVLGVYVYLPGSAGGRA